MFHILPIAISLFFTVLHNSVHESLADSTLFSSLLRLMCYCVILNNAEMSQTPNRTFASHVGTFLQTLLPVSLQQKDGSDGTDHRVPSDDLLARRSNGPGNGRYRGARRLFPAHSGCWILGEFEPKCYVRLKKVSCSNMLSLKRQDCLILWNEC